MGMTQSTPRGEYPDREVRCRLKLKIDGECVERRKRCRMNLNDTLCEVMAQFPQYIIDDDCDGEEKVGWQCHKWKQKHPDCERNPRHRPCVVIHVTRKTSTCTKSLQELIKNGDFADLGGQSLNRNGWGTLDSMPYWDKAVHSEHGGTAPIEIHRGRRSGVPAFPAGWDANKQLLELDSHPDGQPRSNARIVQGVWVPRKGNYVLSITLAGRKRGRGTAESTSSIRVQVQRQDIVPVQAVEHEWSELTIPLRLKCSYIEIALEGTGAEDTYGVIVANVSLRAVCEPVECTNKPLDEYSDSSCDDSDEGSHSDSSDGGRKRRKKKRNRNKKRRGSCSN